MKTNSPLLYQKLKGIYLLHILAGSILTLANLYVDVVKTINLAVDVLNKLYEKNRVFRGILIAHTSDVHKHILAPDYLNDINKLTNSK